MSDFRHLFSPLDIGPIKARNRIVFPGHMTMFSRDGMPTDRMAYYYAERAKGGAAIVVTEISAVHPTTHKYPEVVHSYDERCVPHYARMAAMVHDQGARLVCQLAHSGSRMSSEDSQLPLWAPSTVRSPIAMETPHAMDEDDIAALLQAYGQAARNVRAAGLDGVEIHAAHQYLLSEWLSPLTNRREDEYGGNLEKRFRLVRDVIAAVRAALGRELALGIRINGDDLIDGGNGVEQAKQIAQLIEGTGEIDYISVSAGTSFATYLNVPPMCMPLGAYAHLAAAVRSAVDLPVFAVGRINDPVLAEKVLAEGQADMVGVCRGLIADPEWPAKAREGRLEEIRRCVADNEGCIGRLFKIRPITCIQNPAVGCEAELGIGTLKPAEPRKKIVVVGGGPAGMEVARVAATRGHTVTLYEKQGDLGGQVNIAAKAPFRSELGDVARYLKNELARLGVQVKLGIEATADMVVAEQPDAVVVATGSSPIRPAMPGADQPNVVDYQQVLNEEVSVGENVLLIDDIGHYQAYGTAEFLADRGKRVEIVTAKLSAGADLDLTNLQPLYERLIPKGVRITPITGVRSISGNKVVLFNVYSREERTVEGIDTVVVAVGNRAEDGLFTALRGRVRERHAVGDCVAPRKVMRAIRDGYMLGRTI